MQLSCKRGVGFICVPKCGSTTIESYFRNYSDFTLSGNPRLKHIKYVEYEKHLLPLIQSLRIVPPKIFAVLRDPNDWVKSWYQFRKRDELADANHPQHHNYSGKVTFDRFAELCMSARPPSFARIQSQSAYLLNKAGEVGVDRIFALHQIETEVPQFLKGFGITVKDSKKRKNISEVRVSDTLDASTLEKLRNHFEKDYMLYEQCLVGKAPLSLNNPF